MKSIIYDKTLGRFDEADLNSNGEYTVPYYIKYIEEVAFFKCYKLKSVVLPDNLSEIRTSAFYGCRNLQRVKLPSNLRYLGHRVFEGCANLKSVELSSNIQIIFSYVFNMCPNLTEFIIDGKKITVNDSIKNNFSEYYPFLVYATKNNKFIPKNKDVVVNTNISQIPNFYKHAKDWQYVLNSYLAMWEKRMTDVHIKNLTVSDLYKVSTALGLFQDGENGIMAKNFILNEIMKLNPSTIHFLYGSMNTQEYGYQEEFAKFYIKNYIPLENNNGCYFLEGMVEDMFGINIVNYTAGAYNNWRVVKEVFPNKTVLAHREQGSENNNLTVNDVINAISCSIYENVDDDNSEMYEIVRRYGYTQKQFETLQEWWNEGKNITQNQMILKLSPDTEEKGITFKLLEKNDPQGLIVGELTNCCQTVNNVGKECLHYGATKTNSGFIEFMLNDKIVGQSWVWYNNETGIVCLDNIEIPTIWYKELKHKEFQQDFAKCLVRLGNSFKQEMEKNGKIVNAVTIGAGFNDLPIITNFKQVDGSKSPLPSDYDEYSDAKSIQYIVPANERVIGTYKEMEK